MIEAITKFFLETVGREWCVFFCSMLPIIELRGAIPLGAGLGIPLWLCYGLSVVGNMLPVPFLLLLLRWILQWMKKLPVLSKFALWLEKRAEKSRGKIEKCAFWGLFLFVAIPLPGTGAWTGSLIASLAGMKFYQSFFAILLGVLCAGGIMLTLSYGTVAVIEWL